jgi:hypothetical protein
VQLAVNLESVVLHNYELDADEAHMNHSTSSSSKVACFVFNAFLAKSLTLLHQWMLIF